jgi:NitT/TauT family transport system permease protein
MTTMKQLSTERGGILPSRRKTGRRLRDIGTGVGYVVLAVVIVLAVWELVLTFTHPASFVLPGVGSVLSALKALVATSPTAAGSMWGQLWSTLAGTLLAFASGAIVGIVVGVLMGEFMVIRKLIMPYMVALQSLPKAALVPVIIAWVGYGLISKVSIGFILAVFAVIVNTLQGITAVDENQIHLVRSLGAGRWQELRYIRWPAALPSVFTGLELSVVYALLGVVVAEVLGAQAGIGVMITQLESDSDTAGIFALLIILAIVGFVLHWSVTFAHARLAWWDRPASARRVRRAPARSAPASDSSSTA